MRFDPKTLHNFPTKQGVYLMKTHLGDVLYVGKAKNLRSRIKQYFSGQDQRPLIPYLLEKVEDIHTIITFTESEALILENQLIKKYQPKYNVVLKDDKTHISLRINTHHPYPRLQIIRHKEKVQDKALYFGPYPSALMARETFDILNKIFPIRECSDRELRSRTRPCILYSIKRCIAPCVKKCSKLQYQMHVEQLIEILKGNTSSVVNRLKKAMHNAAAKLEFEQAEVYRIMIERINALPSQHLPVHSDPHDIDVIGYQRKGAYVLLVKLLFRNGELISSEYFDFSQILSDDDALLTTFLLQHYENIATAPKYVYLPCELKKREILSEILQKSIQFIVPQKGKKARLVALAMENAKTLFKEEQCRKESAQDALVSLQEQLHLQRFPHHIACFDTSHLFGKHPTASMVIFINGLYDAQKSRVYHVRNVKHGDDYGAMKEVLERSIQRAIKEDTLPDLLLLDGGKGQLAIAEHVLQESNVVTTECIALAKEASRHDKGLTQEKIYTTKSGAPILLSTNSPVLFLLQRARDEAHRRTINFFRKTHKKALIKSELEQIPGIGPKKRARLLQYFGSTKQVIDATEQELLQVSGISSKDAATIRSWVDKSKK